MIDEKPLFWRESIDIFVEGRHHTAHLMWIIKICTNAVEQNIPLHAQAEGMVFYKTKFPVYSRFSRHLGKFHTRSINHFPK